MSALLGPLVIALGAVATAQEAEEESAVAGDAEATSAALAAAVTRTVEAESYAWTSTMTWGNRDPRVSTGKKGAGGFYLLTMPGRDGAMDILLRDGKGVAKRDGEWELIESGENAEGQGPRRGWFLARMVESFTGPAADLAELAKQVTGVQSSEGGTIVAELGEEAAKEHLSFRGRRGRRGGDEGFQAPPITGAGGKVSFTIVDGAVTKYELTLQGMMNFNGEDRDIGRTTVVEFSEVGATSFDIPEAAAGLLMDAGS